MGMFSEIQAANCEDYHDPTTVSDIAYCRSAGSDGNTEAGTWISYQGQASTEAVVDYGKALGLGGYFTFDTSMDSTTEKYKLHKAIKARMGGSPGPSPPASSYKCVGGQCVTSEGGIDKVTCESMCSPPASYKCVGGQCVASEGGIDKV